MKLPVQMQTFDMRTGTLGMSETVDFEISPAPIGTCPECARKHDADQPHDNQSLHYQYTFYGREGRWPTWRDAMAHCSDPIQKLWCDALARRGIVIDGAPEGGKA